VEAKGVMKRGELVGDLLVAGIVAEVIKPACGICLPIKPILFNPYLPIKPILLNPYHTI
jgi:hypothetical protein